MKKYYPVTQVCRALKVEPHVLRYWEKEFELSVKRNSAGRRIYSDDQLERLRLIRHLIREEKMTTKGAKRQIARMKTAPDRPGHAANRKTLLWLKKELIAIRGLLEPDGR